MMAIWKKFDAWLMVLTLRERLLGTLCAVLLLVYLGYQLELSPLYRQRVWRRLWIALAEAESELGLPVTAAQIVELKATQDAVDLEAIELVAVESAARLLPHGEGVGSAEPAHVMSQRPRRMGFHRSQRVQK